MAILAVEEQSQGTKKVSPNSIPCQIHHNGPLDLSSRHWQPETIEGVQTSHFRGRRLLGKTVQLPASHEGAVLTITTNKAAPPTEIWNDNTEDEEDNEDMEGVHVAEKIAIFDHLVIWNHDSVPEGSEDQYIRGIEEWIRMAEAIHNS